MNAKELRIGNWILLETQVTLPSWHRVMPKDIYDISEGLITLQSLSPIPLTPEILEKAGFVRPSEIRDASWDAYILNGLMALVIKRYDGWMVMNYDGSFFSSVILKYLHQLQNLYFALTGTELEITL